MKIFVCLAILAAVSSASPTRERRGVIHQAEEKGGGESIGSSGFHHEIEHEHAKSHQSVKLEHFHPVPVYVKKEHAHLLKHPLEKGKFSHTLKLIHPKTEHQHGYGLVLEDHRHESEASHGYGGGDHGFSEHSDHISEIEHIPEAHEVQQEEGAGELGHHGWGEESQHQASFEPQGYGKYQYSPIDLSHLAGHESHGSEEY